MGRDLPKRVQRRGPGSAIVWMPMATWGVRLTLLLIVVLTIGCDQVSKRVASTHLVDTPRISYLGDAVRLQYAENRGAFLSLGADLPRWARTALFTVGTSLVLDRKSVV